MEAMMLSIQKSSIQWLGGCTFCYFAVGFIHAFVKREIVVDVNEIAEGIVTTNRVYKCSEDTFYGDDIIFLLCRLL